MAINKSLPMGKNASTPEKIKVSKPLIQAGAQYTVVPSTTAGTNNTLATLKRKHCLRCSHGMRLDIRQKTASKTTTHSM